MYTQYVRIFDTGIPHQMLEIALRNQMNRMNFWLLFIRTKSTMKYSLFHFYNAEKQNMLFVFLEKFKGIDFHQKQRNMYRTVIHSGNDTHNKNV